MKRKRNLKLLKWLGRKNFCAQSIKYAPKVYIILTKSQLYGFHPSEYFIFIWLKQKRTRNYEK